MRILRSLLVVSLLLVAACGDDDDDERAAGDDTETTSTTERPTTTTTAAPATTTTTAFDGATTPTSVAATNRAVAALTDVTVADVVVTFTFRDETPGYDVQYVDPPIRQDGSGEEIAVAGTAFLSVRMEPASGVDLSGEEFVETYTGPERIPGSGVIAEVVRTGDFEANLTWVIGVEGERAYRVEVEASMLRVYFST